MPDNIHLYRIELWETCGQPGALQYCPDSLITVEFEGKTRTQACAAACRAYPGYEVASCNMIG